MLQPGCFNTQPPEGGWAYFIAQKKPTIKVSTHSRLKAAGIRAELGKEPLPVSTHSRLKAAGLMWSSRLSGGRLFQHTAA